MDEPFANPNTLPKARTSTLPTASAANELLPLWIWLTIAIWMSCVEVGTLADPISILLALGYGLLSFLVGAVAVSSWHVVWRISLLVFGLVAMSVLVAILLVGYYTVAFGLVSIGLGAWAYRYIGTGRARILVSFSIGYVLGTIIGPVGSATGAVLGALHARRRVRSLAASSGGEDGAMPNRTWRFSLREVFLLTTTIAAVLALIGRYRPFTESPFLEFFNVRQSLIEASQSLGMRLETPDGVVEGRDIARLYHGYAYRQLDVGVRVPDETRRREVMALLFSTVESSLSRNGCTIYSGGSGGHPASGGLNGFSIAYQYRRLRGTFCADSFADGNGGWRLFVSLHEW